jgi:predicted acetyltransferase
VTVTLEAASSPAAREVVEQLWQLYAHDLSAFRGTRPDAHGRFRPGRLPVYFDEPDREVHLVTLDGGPVGFTMVRRLDPDAGPVTDPAAGCAATGHVLGEFFVVRSVRRLGVGRTAALRTLTRHGGRWEVAFQEENPGAARFWRRLAEDAATELGAEAREERRPVPGKPEVPPDTWLVLDLADPAAAAGSSRRQVPVIDPVRPGAGAGPRGG